MPGIVAKNQNDEPKFSRKYIKGVDGFQPVVEIGFRAD
jgi:hypothetical protein